MWTLHTSVGKKRPNGEVFTPWDVWSCCTTTGSCTTKLLNSLTGSVQNKSGKIVVLIKFIGKFSLTIMEDLEEISEQTECMHHFVVQSVSRAAFLYARCLEKGLGIQKDQEKGREYYSMVSYNIYEFRATF